MQRDGKELRSRYERERILKSTSLGARQIDEIRRHDVVTLMDKMEDENGGPTTSWPSCAGSPTGTPRDRMSSRARFKA